MRILAIESSCDETAASVVEKNGKDIRILSNVIASQIDIHKQFGGVFPEKASRAHAEKIITVVEESLQLAANSSQQDTKKPLAVSRKQLANIDLIAVTTGPGLIGSLLIGVNFAKTYAFIKNKPIIGINHWLGHIYSNWTTADSLQTTDQRPQTTTDSSCSPKSVDRSQLPSFPALILIVSGGHTGLVLMKSHNEIITLGQTLDDAAGEAFDKVAKILGLDYPGGPSIAAEAAKCYSSVIPANAGIQSNLDSKSCPQPVWNDKIKLPRPMIDSKNYDFSFSGLKTAVLNETRKIANGLELTADSRKNNAVSRLPLAVSSAIAAEFQQATIDVLIKKTMAAAYEFKPKSICLCGGVSANYELRQQMQKATEKLPWKVSYHIPPLILSTDNAAMIGIAAAYHLDQKTTWDKINANSNLKLS